MKMNEALVARTLRCQRIACGFELKEAGEISGIHKDSLSRIEIGRQDLSVKQLFALAEAYNVTADALLRGEVKVIFDD